MLTIKKELNSRRKPDLKTLVYGKLPPQAPELEEAVIGACLLEKDAFELAIVILPDAECFYMDAHEKIWQAMIDLKQLKEPIDLLTVTEQLRRTNDLEMIGGAYYLTRLSMAVLSSAHVENHARIIAEKYMKRQLIKQSSEIIALAYEDGSDVFDLIDSQKEAVRKIEEGIPTSYTPTLHDIFRKEVIPDIELQRASKSDITGVPTGYPDMDKLTNGWQKADLIIIAAMPGEGKTAIALNLSYNAAEKRYNTLFVSREMIKKVLVKRITAAATRVEFERIQHGNLDDFLFDKVKEIESKFHKLPLLIDDTSVYVEHICNKARKMHKKVPLSLIVVDYLQIVKAKRKCDSREQEVAYISSELKCLAKELEVPVIALSQVNKDSAKRSNKMPVLNDLRESAAIGNDADIVFFIWNEDIGNNAFKQWFVFVKHRNGKCDKIEMVFLGEYQLWVDPHDTLKQSSYKSIYQRYPVSSEENRKWVDDEPFN